MATKGATAETIELELGYVPREVTRSLWYRFRRHRLSLVGLAILLVFSAGAIFAPVISMHDPYEIDLDNIKGAPNASHILGTDGAGRDIWARMLYGSHVTLGVAAVALLIVVVIGTLIGLVSGFVGSWIDNLLMRFTEVVMTFPTFFALLILISIMGATVFNLMLVIGILGWPGLARLVRGQVLSLREMDYVLAARTVGASNRRIVFFHILPGVAPYVAVAATLGLASAILIEAAVNFLGMGVQIPVPTWGNMMTGAQGLHTLKHLPWIWAPPGIAIALTVLAVNFIGDGLRDALDPRMVLH